MWWLLITGWIFNEQVIEKEGLRKASAIKAAQNNGTSQILFLVIHMEES